MCSAGHISFKLSIEIHYTLIFTHIVLVMLLLLTIVRATSGDLYVILLFQGGRGDLCPSFEHKDDTKRAANARGYIRIARHWRLRYF